MDFGEAIKLVRRGYKLKRKGWNGKNQYIELAWCISYKNAKGKIINPNHEAIGNKVIAFIGTSGTQLGWLASQSDMLADDWEIVTEDSEKIKLSSLYGECKNADNNCRQEKLTCKGCYHNEKQKIIEIYCTEKENGDFEIDCERIIDNDVSNGLMKRIMHCLLNDNF